VRETKAEKEEERKKIRLKIRFCDMNVVYFKVMFWETERA
jgi:hypothetical protein